MSKYWSCLAIIIILVHCQAETLTHNITCHANKQQSVLLNQSLNYYQISVNRISSLTPQELTHCTGSSRSLQIDHKDTVFEFVSSDNMTYKQSVYASITTLDSQEEIVEFMIAGSTFYVVTNKNVVYVLEEQSTGKLKKSAANNLPERTRFSVQNKDFFMLQIQSSLFLIFPTTCLICDLNSCVQIEGWKTLKHLTHAQYVKYNNKSFILLSCSEQGFVSYELQYKTLTNYKKYGKDYFNRSISIFDINVRSVDKGEFYVLDYLSGLYSIKLDKKTNEFSRPQLVVNRSNCFAIDGQGYKYFILNCKIEVYHEAGINQYIEHKPTYKYQTILDVELTQKYYAARGFSGFNFYWSSTKFQYPSKYHDAKSIFLANSVQARFRTIQSTQYLYYATLNTIGSYQITQKPAYVKCISGVPTVQEYRIFYTYPCPIAEQLECSHEEHIRYEVWQHREISVTRTLIPTIIAFFAVILVACLIFILYKKYRKQEEQASIKYVVSENEFGLESNR